MDVNLPVPIAIYLAAENPIGLDFVFTLTGNKIASLEILA